jgi:hypothetical protein
MASFIDISDANLSAYTKNGRGADLAVKKQEILNTLVSFYNLAPTDVLYVGFSSFLLANFGDNISVTCISQPARDFLTKQGIEYTYIPESELIDYAKQFQVVVAVDEFFTFAENDQEQKNLVSQICKLATDYVITTLRDYKNQDYKDREFSQPSLVRNEADSVIFLEAHAWDHADRNAWKSTIYEIDQTQKQLVMYGEFQRRTMFFKQLAKFSMDSGAGSFLVHKNLMYKGLIKKNYEHVITIHIDNE